MTNDKRSQGNGQPGHAKANHPNPPRRAVNNLTGFTRRPGAAAWLAGAGFTLAAQGSRYDVEHPRPPVPVEYENTPILAHRAAKMRSDPNRPFGSLNIPYWFGILDDARCAKVAPPWHEASRQYGYCCDDMPGTYCECGFYALPTESRSWHEHNPDLVHLLVELRGKVVNGDNGVFRAERQHVVECRLPACRYKYDARFWRRADPCPVHEVTVVEFHGDNFACAYCSEHAAMPALAYCELCRMSFLDDIDDMCMHRPAFTRVTVDALRAFLPVPLTTTW
jgi:hypothetical protein